MNAVDGLDEADPIHTINTLNYLLNTLVASRKEEDSIKSRSLDGEYLNDYELLL